MSSKEDIINRGYAADRLLSDNTVADALREIEADCAREWAASEPLDAAAREEAYNMTRFIGRFRLKLEQYRDNGQVEKHNAELRLTEARQG